MPTTDKTLTYTITTFDIPQGNGVPEPVQINDRGEVVGDYITNDTQAQQSVSNGFIYENGTFTTIIPPAEVTNLPSSYAASFRIVGINARGEIVGDYNSGVANSGATSGGSQVFVDNNGTFTNINLPFSDYGVGAIGINNSGEVIGEYFGSDNGEAAYQDIGFLYDKGTVTSLLPPGAIYGSTPFAINNRGEVYGSYRDSNGNVNLFLYNKGTYTTLNLPGTVSGLVLSQGVNSINDRGEVVGSYLNSSGAAVGFIYDRGHYTSIAAPGATDTVFTGINDRGEVLGYNENYLGPYSSQSYFVYDNGTFTDLPGAGVSINNRGQVTGTIGSSYQGYIATPVRGCGPYSISASTGYPSASIPTSVSDLLAGQDASALFLPTAPTASAASAQPASASALPDQGAGTSLAALLAAGSSHALLPLLHPGS